MLIRNVTRDQLDLATRMVNVLSGSTIEYRDIEPANKRETAWRLTLRLASSRDVYHRRAQRSRCRCRTSGCDHQPFRMPFVCWHGHRDWMRCLYQLNPEATIISGSIHRGGIWYDGVLDFEARHAETGDRNIGSEYAPVSFADACDCQADGTDALTQPVVSVNEALHIAALFMERLDVAERERETIARRIERASVATPEDYGKSEADGAACRAMANALRAIQHERKEGVTA